jgi:hypothetical protein
MQYKMADISLARLELGYEPRWIKTESSSYYPYGDSSTHHSNPISHPPRLHPRHTPQ